MTLLDARAGGVGADDDGYAKALTLAIKMAAITKIPVIFFIFKKF